jgi:hypothetical protein
MQPQIGVALLSQRTGAKVVPIGFSGLQGSFQRVMQLKRPKLLMRVGKAIPALKPSDSVADKDQLMGYSRQVMDAVYELILKKRKISSPMNRVIRSHCTLRGGNPRSVLGLSDRAFFALTCVVGQSLKLI